MNKQGTLTVNAGKLIGNLEDARRRPLVLVALSIRHVEPGPRSQPVLARSTTPITAAWRRKRRPRRTGSARRSRPR